jgi:uncharacterized protein (UPF0332 family)
MQKRFDWLLYLDVADHLAGREGEGYMRSAVSRAYYGVFCSARDALERLDSVRFPKAQNVHREVIHALKTHRVRELARSGMNLDRLRRERNAADYDSGGDFSPARTQMALLLARDIRRDMRAMEAS